MGATGAGARVHSVGSGSWGYKRSAFSSDVCASHALLGALGHLTHINSTSPISPEKQGSSCPILQVGKLPVVS